jgi:acetyl-CoA acetyltransferase
MVELQDAVVVATARTPMGRYGGQLKDVRPDDLAALVMREAVSRAGVEPAEIEDVVFGCANQAGEDNRNVARMGLLLAGFPVEVPGQTVNRLCGSGMQATISAAREIQAGASTLIVAGGARGHEPGQGLQTPPPCLAGPHQNQSRGAVIER